MHTIINDVPFGGKDYRVYCGSSEEGWERMDMGKRRVEKLAIGLKGFFSDTYGKDKSYLYAQKANSKGVYYPVFITLTYHHQEDWNPKHISTLVDYYRKDWKQRLKRDPSHFRYVWVAEMQKRGVIHYHMVLWCPRGKRLAKPDSEANWKGGRSKIVGVRKGVVGYLSKYLSKGAEPADNKGVVVYFPKGARIFGCGGLCVAARIKIAFKKLPKYVRGVFNSVERVSKVCGGYVQGSTCLESPWKFSLVRFSPIVDVYCPTGWRGGNLTCIFIKYECNFVLFSDKEEYLKGVKSGKA